MVPYAYTEQSHLDLSAIALKVFHTFFPNANHSDAVQLHERSALDLELGFTNAEGARPQNTPSTYQPPTVALERRVDGGEEPKLILKDAESYILQPVRSRVPIIMGMSSSEFDNYGRENTSESIADSPQVPARGGIHLRNRSYTHKRNYYEIARNSREIVAKYAAK